MNSFPIEDNENHIHKCAWQGGKEDVKKKPQNQTKHLQNKKSLRVFSVSF